jgi:hypothetical protein
MTTASGLRLPTACSSSRASSLSSQSEFAPSACTRDPSEIGIVMLWTLLASPSIGRSGVDELAGTSVRKIQEHVRSFSVTTLSLAISMQPQASGLASACLMTIESHRKPPRVRLSTNTRNLSFPHFSVLCLWASDCKHINSRTKCCDRLYLCKLSVISEDERGLNSTVAANVLNISFKEAVCRTCRDDIAFCLAVFLRFAIRNSSWVLA